MKITYENEIIEVPNGLTVKGALKEQIEKSSIKDIIAVRYNNRIESLNMLVTEDGTVEFINRQDKDGRRGCSHRSSFIRSALKRLLTGKKGFRR